jgi:hypothetical protein
MIMDDEYTPIAEAGIGIWNVSSTSSIPPVSNPKTFFHIFESSPMPYVQEQVLEPSINLRIQYDGTTRDLTFGENTINLGNKIPKYVAFHMRGKGINSFTFGNIVYNGLADIPDDDIIKNTNLEKQYISIDLVGNKSSPIWTGKANEQSCATLCNISDECVNFTVDVVSESCTLHSSEEFVNADEGSPSPIPLRTKVNIKRPDISGIFLFYKEDEITYLDGDIMCMSLDNFMRDDFVLMDIYSRTYSGQFDYVLVPHPDTGEGVLSIAISYGLSVDDQFTYFLIFNSQTDVIMIDKNMEKTNINIVQLDNDTNFENLLKTTNDTIFYNYEVTVPEFQPLYDSASDKKMLENLNSLLGQADTLFTNDIINKITPDFSSALSNSLITSPTTITDNLSNTLTDQIKDKTTVILSTLSSINILLDEANGTSVDSTYVETAMNAISEIFSDFENFIELIDGFSNSLTSISDYLTSRSEYFINNQASFSDENDVEKIYLVFDTLIDIISTSSTYIDKIWSISDMIVAYFDTTISPSPSPSPKQSPFPDTLIVNDTYLYYDTEGNKLDPPMMIPKLVATDKWFELGNQGTTYSYSAGTPVNNKIFKSSSLNKIILSTSPYTSLMSIYTGMYILLDDNSLWPALKKGSFFSYQDNPKGIWYPSFGEQEDV